MLLLPRIPVVPLCARTSIAPLPRPQYCIPQVWFKSKGSDDDDLVLKVLFTQPTHSTATNSVAVLLYKSAKRRAIFTQFSPTLPTQ